MIVRVHKVGDNKGSSSNLLEYLNKEDEKKDFFARTAFFDHDKENILLGEAVRKIDENKGRLAKDENKFYMLTINPSGKELHHLMPKGIHKTEDLTEKQMQEYEKKLQDYTRKVMESYARSFHREVKGKDLVYVAKIEHNRYYSGKEAKELGVKQRAKKEGLQTHVHVVVHRYDKEKTKKLSPLANKYAVSGNTTLNNRKVQSGFNHLDFRLDNEKTFDKMFAYSRGKQEKITTNLEEGKKGFSTQAKDLILYSDASPISDIRKEWNKQDMRTIFSNQLKHMNPISSFLREEQQAIKDAVNYAKN